MNESLHQWRNNLSRAPAFRLEDQDELESHLIDSVASLQAAGLSAREAFWVATSRIGTTDALDAEFGKVNTEHVWLDRALWMVVGSLGILAVSSLGSVVGSVSTIVVNQVTTQASIVAPIGLAVYVVVPLALLAVLWRSGRQRNGVVWRFVSWMQAHPVAGAVGVGLFFALNIVSSMMTTWFTSQFMPITTFGLVMQWRWFSVLFPVLFWPVVLGWLLRRTAPKPIL